MTTADPPPNEPHVKVVFERYDDVLNVDEVKPRPGSSPGAPAWADI
jgi:hypothetical protein